MRAGLRTLIGVGVLVGSTGACGADTAPLTSEPAAVLPDGGVLLDLSEVDLASWRPHCSEPDGGLAPPSYDPAYSLVVANAFCEAWARASSGYPFAHAVADPYLGQCIVGDHCDPTSGIGAGPSYCHCGVRFCFPGSETCVSDSSDGPAHCTLACP